MVQLNDEVFLRKLKYNVKYLRDRHFHTLLPGGKPETIEQYEERLEKYRDFTSAAYERLREMNDILELVEPSHINMAARTILEFYNGILVNPPWAIHTQPHPMQYARPGRPVAVKPEEEAPDEEVGPEG